MTNLKARRCLIYLLFLTQRNTSHFSYRESLRHLQNALVSVDHTHFAMPVLVIVHAPYVTIEPHSAVGERDTERGKDEHAVRVLNSQTESCALFQRLTIQCMLSSF